MDIEQKKTDLKEDLAGQPSNLVLARIDICDQVQLADLMKVQFTSYFRQAANTSHSNSETLHEVCQNLAKQRALLHGANVGTILKFNIAATSTYTTNGTLTFPEFEDSSYSNKTTIPFIVLHNINKVGGTVTLSTTSNANTNITDDDGNSITYFTDFSKYFLSRSRANGELISVDENSAPYSTPTGAEPFLPPNTINGETFVSPVVDPTANSDVRYEYSLVANSEPIAGGYVGGGYDLAEDYYTGNTFVTLKLSNVSGTFTVSETLTDFEGETATIKTYSNTSTVVLETTDSKGTFTIGETLSDSTTNATVSSIESVSNTSINITLTGNTFLTGSNTDITLGFSSSNTISLDTDTGTVSRSGSTVTVIANSHGIESGERIALKGADAEFGEFNDTFIVQGVTANTLSFVTSNATSVSPTGSFSLVKNIIFGQTSNASSAVSLRTVNASANIVFQSSNLSTGFAIVNTVSNDAGSTGTIDNRTIGGAWYQSRTKEAKTFNSGTGTWTIDTAANTGEFWNKNFEPVRISTIVSTSGTGSSTLAAKMVLTKAIATSGDTSGGYDSTAITKFPGTYLSYPLKTWADQVHGTVTTIEAYDNFANVVIAPEGLEVNFDWLPLGLGNDGTDLNQNGTVDTAAYNAEEVTTLDKTEFELKLGSYGSVATANSTGGFPNAPDDVFLSCIPANRSSAKKVGTSGAVYPLANTNPFFPSVGGTQKPIANTSDGITGTQPGGLDENSIYAGSYTEVQKGALDPPPQTDPQTIKMNNRFIIQNDLKWIYASNPFDANTSAGGSSTYNAPQTAAYHSIFDGSLDGEIGAASGQSADGTSGSTVVDIPADVAIICTTVAHATNGNTGIAFTTGTVGARSNMILKDSQTCVADEYSCTGGTSDGTEASSSECTAVGGAWAATASSPASSTAEFPCLYNRVQAVMTSAGGALSVGSTSGMETNFAIFYQLLLDLISASYGKDYTDPVELTAAGSYTELGRSDASLKTAVETMKSRVDTVIGLHNTERSNVGTRIGTSFSHPGAYKTAVDSMFSYLGNFRSAVGNRILEISNRIGYLNGKNTASGGSNFISSVVDYLLLNGTDGSSTDEGDNILCEPVLDNALIQMESEVSASISVGSAGDGFAGYSFSGGSGYANTIYSHANFLAGKKIKLIAKILSAIEDVDAAYTQITSKRGEYYEYNQ